MGGLHDHAFTRLTDLRLLLFLLGISHFISVLQLIAPLLHHFFIFLLFIMLLRRAFLIIFVITLINLLIHAAALCNDLLELFVAGYLLPLSDHS